MAAVGAQPPTYDLVIRNARIVDGTGTPWNRGDIALRGDSARGVIIDDFVRFEQDGNKGFRLTKPLIAAVEGPAIAGGTEILQGTDIRIAGESA